MAIIPGEEQYSGIPSPRSGRQIAQYDTTAVQRGLSALGEGIAGFGSQLTKVAENVIIKRQETATYDAEARFQQFRFNEAQRFSEDIRNVPAGGAAQYADNWTAGYRERARQFFDTIPEELRPDYDLKLFATEREFYANGLEFEQAEMARFTIQQTEQTLNNTVLPQVVAARESPNPQQALEEAIAMGTALITNNPHLTPTEKDVGLLEWRERAQRAFLDGLPAEDRAGWLGTDPVSIADRIIQLESGGNATAANPNSTALGPGQFLEETWLGLLARHRPDLVENPEFDRETLLALRTDPELSRQMLDAFTAENTRYLQDRGIAITPGNVYLAHFLGAAGAVAVLRADPRMNMSSLVSDDAIAANRSILEGKTAAQVIQWAENLMAGTRGTTVGLLDAIPYEDRQTLTADAAADVTRQRNAQAAQEEAVYQQQLNALLVGIHDGRYGMSEINDARRSWLGDYSDITRVEEAFNKANGEQLDLAAALRDFDNPDYQFSQWESSDQDKADLVFESMGGVGALLTGGEGQPAAMLRLQAVVERAGIIPSTALAQLRTGIYSPNEQIRTAAFTILDGLYRGNPALIENTLNDQDLTRIQRYQELAPLMPPEQLAQVLNPSQDPRDVARRETLRAEGRTLAAAVPLPAILQAFDPNVLPGNQPLQPLDPGMQRALRDDFATLYAENYALTGNADVSQRLALQALNQKWGATDIGPDRRLMPYPPENHYPPIDNSHEWMEQDLRTYIEENYGTDTQDWGVVPSMATEANLEPRVDANGVTHYTPYDIWVIDANGVVRIERGFEFEYQKYRDQNWQEFTEERRNATRDAQFDMLFPETPPPTGRDGPLVPELPGAEHRVPFEINEFGIPVTRGTPLTQQEADNEAERDALRQQEVQQRGILFRERARAVANEMATTGPTLP